MSTLNIKPLLYDVLDVIKVIYVDDEDTRYYPYPVLYLQDGERLCIDDFDDERDYYVYIEDNYDDVKRVTFEAEDSGGEYFKFNTLNALNK